TQIVGETRFYSLPFAFFEAVETNPGSFRVLEGARILPRLRALALELLVLARGVQVHERGRLHLRRLRPVGADDLARSDVAAQGEQLREERAAEEHGVPPLLAVDGHGERGAGSEGVDELPHDPWIDAGLVPERDQHGFRAGGGGDAAA